MTNKKLKILVLAGGPSSEHEVSLRTAQMVLKNLDPQKYRASLAVIKKDKKWHFHPGGKPMHIGDAMKRLNPSRFDFVFIAMHGPFGEDGRMQAILEWAGLPYAGSGVVSSAMAMDKGVSNILYKTNGLRVPRYVVLRRGANVKGLKIALPVVVKPVNGGSSVGVSIVKAKKELGKALNVAFKEGDRVMLQGYIKGRELTCGVLEDEEGTPFALPPTEIIPKTSSFFDYRAKYKVGGSLEITPARLAEPKLKELQQLALKAHTTLGCRGMSRSDFILRGNKFYILETNTIPGMTETSLLPQAAKVAGIDFPSLLDLMIAGELRKK
ncbi:MAG TPA: D-alanine--D-alanine ligase [Candidatus Paceibacterota bacterium]|jgi:D-alanine-D-alanine ligase|nr:D-alanine--D-alanine ligase [Candidatus Paceibacterota bacterium]